MRPGIATATRNLLDDGHYLLHHRFKVANGSGTYINLDGRYTHGVLTMPNPSMPIGSLSMDFVREFTHSGSDSLAPYVQASTFNRLDDGVTYSPLLFIGRPVTHEMALTGLNGTRPNADSTLWHEVFRGFITDVDWPQWDSRKARIVCADQAGYLKIAKSEAEYVYTAGTSIETAIQQVLVNNGFPSVTLNVPVATGKVLTRDYAPGLQKTVWEQIWALAQSIGWVIWYRYTGRTTSALTLFNPDRDNETSIFTVPFVQEFESLGINEREIGNVAYGFVSDENGVRQPVGPVVDQASIDRHGGMRRTYWINFPEDSPVRSVADATAVLNLAIKDTADPDIIATAKVPANPFTEPAVDVYTYPANKKFFDVAQKYSPFAATVEFTVDQEAFSTQQLRGRPSVGLRTWKALTYDPKAAAGTQPYAEITALPLLAGEDPAKHARFRLEAKGPEGTTLEYSTVIGAAPVAAPSNPYEFLLTRPADEVLPREIVAVAVGPDGTRRANSTLWDWNSDPSVKAAGSPVPWLNGTEQQGWEINVGVDDDTRGLLVTTSGSLGTVSGVPAGSSVSGGRWWDTTTTKTVTVRVLQSPGQVGTLVITPYRNSTNADRGRAGPALSQKLERAPITTHSFVAAGQDKNLRISIEPTDGIIRYRVMDPDPAKQVWATSPGPSVIVPVGVTAGVTTVEYHGYMTNGPAESIKRVRLDPGVEPYAEAVKLDEAAGPNLLTATLVEVDDDVIGYAIWARLGASPYKAGTTVPDDTYLRASGNPKDGVSHTWYAPAGTWHVVARVYGEKGTFIDRTATFNVVGVAQAVGALGNLAVALNGSNHRITWTHNSAAGLSNGVDTHKVVILETEGGVTREVVTLSANRGATWEAGGTTNPTGGGGGHDVPVAVGGTTTKQFQYEVRLYTMDNEFVSSYFVSITGSTYADTSGGGGGTTQPPGSSPTSVTLYQHSPVNTTTGQIRSEWVNTSNSYAVEIEYMEVVGLQMNRLDVVQVNAGTTQHVLTAPKGMQVRAYARYVNANGAGPWSAISNTVTVP